MEKNFTIEEIERLVENIAVNKCHLSKRIYNKAIATAPYIYIEQTEKGLDVEAVSQINSALHNYWDKITKELSNSNFSIPRVSRWVDGNLNHMIMNISGV